MACMSKDCSCNDPAPEPNKSPERGEIKLISHVGNVCSICGNNNACTCFSSSTGEKNLCCYCEMGQSCRGRNCLEVKELLAEKERRIAELEELNCKAKDVLEKTLDCEASASVARNRLEIKLNDIQQMAEKMAGALKQIACSAPCTDNHESFNSPGQPCDQRIANEALDSYKAMKGEI